MQILYVLGLFICVMLTFNIVGPDRFADYLAYVYFRSGTQFYDYLFELISRSILNSTTGLINGWNRADNLILFCNVWAWGAFVGFCLRDGLKLQAFVVFASLFFPFILTTGLRISPAYPAFFIVMYAYNNGNISLNRVIMWLIPLSLLFHDSILIILAFFIGMKLVFVLGMTGPKIRYTIIFISVIITLSGPLLGVSLITAIAEAYLGGRSVYVGGGINSPVLTIVYFAGCCGLVFLAMRDGNVSDPMKTAISFFLLFNCLVLCLAPVAAVRFSHFLFILLIASRACMFFSWERTNAYRIPSIIMYLFVFRVQISQVII